MRAGRVGKSRIILAWLGQKCRCLINAGCSNKFVKKCRKQLYKVLGWTIVPCQTVFNPEKLNCRADLLYNLTQTLLEVKICGKIILDAPGRHIRLHIRLKDITEDIDNPQPVFENLPPNLPGEQRDFEHICELGKVPDISIQISDWLSVAKIQTQSILSAHRGLTRILVQLELVVCETSQILDNAQDWLEYQQENRGYLDIQQNIESAKILGAALALAIISSDGKIDESQAQYVKSWAKNYGGSFFKKSTNSRKLERILNNTLRFFEKGQKADISRICMDLSQRVPIAYRYDILALCLCAVVIKGIITSEQLKLLKDAAFRLQVNMDKFRSMLERLAPAATHQVKDMELLCGLTSQMSVDQSIERLNQEYRKWNARATSLDRDIQNQAEQMLELIAQKRSNYTS
ncbi:MAG: hypothetical protein WCZ89_00435 [Phycisphaerae bacterium]